MTGSGTERMAEDGGGRSAARDVLAPHRENGAAGLPDTADDLVDHAVVDGVDPAQRDGARLRPPR